MGVELANDLLEEPAVAPSVANKESEIMLMQVTVHVKSAADTVQTKDSTNNY